MKNVTIFTNNDGKEYAIIDNGNNEFTSMPKAVWDELQAQQDNPIGGTK